MEDNLVNERGQRILVVRELLRILPNIFAHSLESVEVQEPLRRRTAKITPTNMEQDTGTHL